LADTCGTNTTVQTFVATTTVGTIPTWFTITFSICTWCALTITATLVRTVFDFTCNTFPPVFTLAAFWGTNAGTTAATFIWATN
jgi:hypothetical protein